MIKILVLSDLHIKEGEIFQKKILQNVISLIDERISRGDEFNLVMVIGDITSSGLKNEFEIALNFFNKLKASLNIESNRFLFVPGNHDYSRNALGTSYKYVPVLEHHLFLLFTSLG